MDRRSALARLGGAVAGLLAVARPPRKETAAAPVMRPPLRVPDGAPPTAGSYQWVTLEATPYEATTWAAPHDAAPPFNWLRIPGNVE